MDDGQLDELLRGLPRERASDRFTAQVMLRLQPPRPARRWPLKLALAAGLAAVALAAVSFGLWRAERLAKQEIQEQIHQLRTEHRELEATLAHLRTQEERARPVVYLGGDQRVDYVLDLRKALAAPPAEPRRVLPTGGTL